MQKTMLHPDYWVEVPAGEFIKGLSAAQRQRLQAQARSLDPTKRAQVEDHLSVLNDQKIYSTDRFYIARFPVIHGQIPGANKALATIPGALENCFPPKEREVQTASRDWPGQFLQELGGRYPSIEEWHKAAGGTDGRLYPWGDEWDPAAGYFYYGQPTPGRKRVDAFPRGISPYGAWTMAGGLCEEVGPKGQWRRGYHPKESSAETAWFDHVLARVGHGWWVSLRPVLDEWPAYPLSGFQAGLAVPSAEGRQKMGLLADLLLTQYRWERLPTATLDRLEGAIVALREGRRADCLDLLAAPLADQPQLEAAWLLRLAALEELSEQRAALQQALTLAPQSEVGQKLAALLQDPARLV